MRVAFAGEPGAYGDLAARAFDSEAETVGVATFDDVVAAVMAGDTVAGVVPIENSITGLVPRAFDLLAGDSRVRIADEVELPIETALIGLPGGTPGALREVRSHPLALEQCRGFFALHPELARRPTGDTAGAVREIVELGDPGIGAIAAPSAAERYGAEVYQRGLVDRENVTRFLVLSRDALPSPLPTRATVALTLPRRTASLRDALDAVADAGFALRTILSCPSVDPSFSVFVLELERADARRLAAVLGEIAGEARILGTY